MDTSTVGIVFAVVVGILTTLGGWFKLSRASKFIEGRLAYLEEHSKIFVTVEQVAERVKSFEARFSGLDGFIKEELDKLQGELAILDSSCRCYDRDITRLQESLKVIDSFRSKLDDLAKLRAEFLEKFTKRGEFIHEIQSVVSQLRLVQQKIDRVDDKIDEKLVRK